MIFWGFIYNSAQIALDRVAERFDTAPLQVAPPASRIRSQSPSNSGVPPCSTALDHRLRKAIWRHGHAHILFHIAFSGLIGAVKRVVVACSLVPRRFFRVIRHLCLPALLMLSTFNTSWVESRRGAVAWALWASLRFLSPLIKPDVRISRIRLLDRLHLKAHGGGPRWTRRRRITPNSPNATVSGKRMVPRDDTLWPVPPSP